MECSNMGKCNRATGECICRLGFEGAACERLECPGESSLSGRTDDLAPTSGSVPCNNAGRCLSMRNLARYAKNTDLMYHSDPNALPSVPATDAAGASTATIGTTASYGYIPNKASTWDADRIQGCLADEYGYTPTHNVNSGVNTATTSESVASAHTVAKNQSAIGYDLSKMPCPFGYSSRHIKYSNDLTNITSVQSLQCRGSSGNFVLSFRNHQSIVGAVTTAQIRDLKAVLQSMRTVGTVTVTAPTGFTDTSLLCDLSSSAPLVEIEFTSEFGPLPLLQQHVSSTIAGDSSSALYIEEVRGFPADETALQECSGHGHCSYSSGVCKCFPHWGSSDGLGGIGTLGDCGHQLVY